MSSTTPSSGWGPESYDAFEQSVTDWRIRYVECARKFGADAKILPNGSIDNAVAKGRPTTDGLDAACVADLGTWPEAPPATPEFLDGLYLLYLQQADCLREHGYAISQPPSQVDWVENYSGESWNPLMDVYLAGLDNSIANDVCPQPDEAEAWRLGYAQQ